MNRVLDNALRVAWLRRNRSVWEGHEIGPRSETKRAIFGMMQVAGLYSWTTVWSDTAIDLMVERIRAND